MGESQVLVLIMENPQSKSATTVAAEFHELLNIG
jgi:hypothetical protein